MAYTCNKTAYFKAREGRATVAALRSMFGRGLPSLPDTLTIVDDYTVHKQAEFTEGMASINSRPTILILMLMLVTCSLKV